MLSVRNDVCKVPVTDIGALGCARIKRRSLTSQQQLLQFSWTETFSTFPVNANGTW